MTSTTRTYTVTAAAEMDPNDRIVKLVELHECEPAPPPSTELQDSLRAMAALESGWMDGQGAPISGHLLSSLQVFLQTAERKGLPKPRLYPTLEGGVQGEWTFGPWEVSATFGPTTSEPMRLSAVRTSGQEFDDALSWGSASSAEYLTDWVGEFYFDDHGDEEGDA